MIIIALNRYLPTFRSNSNQCQTLRNSHIIAYEECLYPVNPRRHQIGQTPATQNAGAPQINHTSAPAIRPRLQLRGIRPCGARRICGQLNASRVQYRSIAGAPIKPHLPTAYRPADVVGKPRPIPQHRRCPYKASSANRIQAGRCG